MFKDIDIKFVNKEITPFGGLSLFFKAADQSHKQAQDLLEKWEKEK